MGLPESIETERLLLRRWRQTDLELLRALNSDPRVMEHFPSVQTREESDAMAARIRSHFKAEGFGLWAVEVLKGAEFIGFVGLSIPSFKSHFTPCVEVGWRLAQSHWGQGYAPEGARASLRFGFEELGLDEIVSMTVPANHKSRRVMEKIGMHREESEHFDHPMMAPGDPLRRHVLYRLRRDEWGFLVG